MPDLQLDEKAIFNIARQIPSEGARAEYLQQVTGGNPLLRDRVLLLLKGYEDHQSFLDLPCSPVAATIDFSPVAERPGTQIGPYKLIQEIGEGGMGMVFMALQKEPVRRKVALKIIKPGMDTREVIARFEAEEQALAMMDHPNIARVLDAAATESGRPYFVMELVNGVPLTEYCDENSLDTRERLELFVTVCRAVQHAHQKGIIHRDLKPSNILVTLHDGVPVPKVIDFGIAKAVNQELTSKTLTTGLGHMIGTPLYMSPEQAERSGLDIDTRSDIYSLGVVLYELLTGSTPFDREQFKDTPLDEIRRVIREQEPPRPSTRISTLGQAATTASAHRRTDPAQLSKALRHELDWIVMKALEKDRTRRYATANDFARDIERYLHDEPVEACPPSAAYRLKKLVRRNRTLVLATAAVSLALILGAGIATGQAIRATKAERLAEEQLGIARAQQRLARAQAKLAQQQKRLAEESAERERELRIEAEAARKQAETVTDFLVEIFRSPDPARDGRTITVAEMLDQAKTRVETEFQDDAVLQAKLLGAIGETYEGLGLVQKSLEMTQKSYDQLREDLGPEHEDTLRAMWNLAGAYVAAAQWDAAITLVQELLSIYKATLTLEHPKTLEIMSGLADSYYHSGDTEEAIRLYEETLSLRQRTLGATHRDTLQSMHSLARAYSKGESLDKAVTLQEETLALQKTALGPKDPHTLRSMNSLAVWYALLGRRDDAIAVREELLRLSREVLGPEHPETLGAMGNLVRDYKQFGQIEKATPLVEEWLRLSEEHLGSAHGITIGAMQELASIYEQQGRHDEELLLREKALECVQAARGANHPGTLNAMLDLAGTYQRSGQLDRAAALCEELLRLSQQHLGSADMITIGTMQQVASIYRQQSRYDEELQLRDKAFEYLQATRGPNHPDTLRQLVQLANIYCSRNRFDRAIPMHEDALARSEAAFGATHPETLSCMTRLGRDYLSAGRFHQAVSVLEDALGPCEEVLDPLSMTTFECQFLLAHAYAEYARFVDAFTLADGMLERLKAAELDEKHRAMIAARFQLAKLYEKADRLSEAVSQFEELLTRIRESQWYGPEHQLTLECQTSLGRVYRKVGRIEEAIEILEDSLAQHRAKLGNEHLNTWTTIHDLAAAYLERGEIENALKLSKEAADARRKVLGAEHPATLESLALLAHIHLRREEYTEAEPLLLEAYQGIVKRQGEDATPGDKRMLHEILTSLVDVYDKTNQPDKAAEWKKQLEAVQEPAAEASAEERPQE